MKNIVITLGFIFMLLYTACSVSATNEIAATSTSRIPQNTIKASILPHGMFSVDELKTLMENEDIFLVNVHVPFEGSIPETDLVVPYNEINESISFFPADKDQKIVVYCKAGSMGNDAAQTLIALGYTNVWNLVGGYDAWKEAGLLFDAK